MVSTSSIIQRQNLFEIIEIDPALFEDDAAWSVLQNGVGNFFLQLEVVDVLRNSPDACVEFAESTIGFNGEGGPALTLKEFPCFVDDKQIVLIIIRGGFPLNVLS